MELKIITGAAKSGKTSYVFEMIQEGIKEKSSSHLLIVPDQITYMKEKELIEYLETEGILNVQVLSLKRLAYMILEETGGVKIPSIDIYGKIMMLKKISEEKKSDLKLFGGKSGSQGTLKKVAEITRELKLCGVSPQFLSSVEKNIENENFREKISDIKVFYESLEKKLQEKYLDDEDIINKACRKSGDSNYVRNSCIYFDDFTGFTWIELQILREIIKFSKKTVVSLPYLPETDSSKCTDQFRSIGSLLSKIKNMAEELGVKPQYTEMTYGRKFREDISFMAQNIFGWNKCTYKGEMGNILLHYMETPEKETEYIAESIMTAVREKDYRWKDIYVFTGSTEIYQNNIKRIFSQYNIPFFIDAKRNIMSHPLVVLIMSYIDSVLWNYKTQDVIRFIKTGYCDLTYEESEEMENFAVKWGIKGYKWFSIFKYTDDDNDKAEGIRKKVDDLFSDKNKLKDTGLTGEKIKTIVELLEKTKSREKILQETSDLKEKGLFEQAYENSGIWNGITDLLDQISGIYGDEEISLKQFRDMIITGIEEFTYSIIPPSEDCVTVGSIDRTGIMNAKEIFVAGMNEENIPKLYEDAGLLYDDEKDYLTLMGAELFRKEIFEDNERLNLYRILSSVGDKVHISWSLSDNDGKPLNPSRYIRRIREIFPQISISGKIKEQSVLLGRPYPAFGNILEKISGRAGIDSLTQKEWEAAAWINENNSQLRGIIKKGFAYRNRAEISDDQLKDGLYREFGQISPVHIEDFSNCPFKYFSEKILGLSKRDEYSVGMNDIGTLYHKAIEKITENLIENGETEICKSDEEILKNAQNAVSLVLEELDSNHPIDESRRNIYLKEKISGTVKKTALNIVKQLRKGDFRPKYSEYIIDSGENVFELSDGRKIFLKGRIDRVDICVIDGREYVNIIDYKSSSREMDLNKIINGLQIQLAVYMDAYVKREGGKRAVAGIYYFTIDNPMIDGDKLETSVEEAVFNTYRLDGYSIDDNVVIEKIDREITDTKKSGIINVSLKKDGDYTTSSRVLNQDQMKGLIKITRKKVVETAERIISGDISIEPAKINETVPCRYCDFMSFCQFDSTLPENNYNSIKKIKKNDVLNLLEKEGSGND